MLSLDSLFLRSIDAQHIDSVFNDRLLLIEQAHAIGDEELLRAIAALDKKNIDFLIQEKNKMEIEMINLNKIKDYLVG